MATATKWSAAAAKTKLDAITATLNSGTVKIYTGTAPTNVETGATGTLLVTCTLNSTAFAGAVATTGTNAVATANAITSGTAGASGTAGYFRTATSGGTDVLQGTVGTSAADLIIANTSISSGATISVSSYTITEPCQGV